MAHNTIEIRIAIVKKRTIAELLEKCSSLHLTPNAINVEGDIQNFNFVDLAPRTATSNIKALRRASGLFAITLVVVAFSAIEWRSVVEQRALNAELNHLATQASVAEGFKKRIEELAERSDFINARLRKVPRTDVLNELTKRLPNTVWLTDLHIQDDNLTMYGNAVSATTLIKILEASPLVANPHFVAPIVAWEGGYEHFEISMAIRNRG